ncbi:hypothetical protein GGS24DRAFT_480571 [Hypoxylon argillaceum]|nr:hypothetical protein GGS24DRAFT_480571 [Hypoxylon argillaceum]
MAVARPALSAASCSQCRSLVLNLFTSSTLRSVPVARPSLSYTRAHIVGALPLRRFSSLPKPTNPALDAEHGEHGESVRVVEDEQENNDENDDGENETVTGNSLANVPWYLQVEPPTHMAPLEPPPLPEIPPDAPPLIRSLLEYASEQMGLDALSLLDLRKLDPAPALGPNLFMLFGTARSERHLSVSAGRLVRWLRAKHRVHADADGLLGPNERKIKLRRRARRAKLLGTMGTDDADDGIRTGWVCVNLGTIDRGGAESVVVAEDGRVSGFGISHVGSTIVFQIMTEGRRAEMGLETLWTRSLARALSPSVNSDSGNKDQEPISRSRSEKNLHPVEKAMMANLHRPSGFPPSSRGGQSSRSSPPNQARFYSAQQPLMSSTEDVDPLSTSSPEGLAHVLTYDAQQKQRLLELLRVQLDEMDAGSARAALGESNNGSQQTPFTELMQLAMDTLPPSRTWEYRLAVQYKASVSGLPKAVRSLDNVRLLTEELQIYGIKATRNQYLQLLSCVLQVKEQHPAVTNLALDIINTMQQRNESIMANDLIVTIIEGASKGSGGGPWFRELIARLEQLLFQPDFPYMGEKLVMRLMTAYAHRMNWNGVWNAWGIPARNLRARSADMYIHIYQLAAATLSPKLCMQVLRRCVPDSGSEDPPVHGDREASRAALGCVQIADPRAIEYAKSLPSNARGQLRRLADREFVKLARLLMNH